MTLLGHLELLRIFARHQVPVVVIGGHAVGFHGHVRMTEDLDLIWRRSPAVEGALVAALREANARWMSDEVDRSTGLEKLVPVSEPYVQSNHLMVLVTDHGFLDLFDYVPGVPDASVESVFADSVLVGDIHYVSLPWLKRMKRAAGRPRDHEDLERLP